MSEIKDGGPLFLYDYIERGGMSLRDWFAGQSLAAMGQWCPYPVENLNSDKAREVRARMAYAEADAMLAARSLTKEGGEE